MILKLKRTPGIFLVGFMGSGKTTLGRMLADEVGWPFADLDDDITHNAELPVTEIFSKQGEQEFRRLEHEALTRRIHSIGLGRPLVLALGGGAFVQPFNHSLLSHNGVSVWLDCPLDIIERRINGNTTRPLARDPHNMRNLFNMRRDAYALADFHVEVASDNPRHNLSALLRLPIFK